MNSGTGASGTAPMAVQSPIAGGGSTGKRRAGSKLGQMRFTQRAAQKAAATAAQDQPAAEQDPMRWEANADGGSSGGGGCIVITEDAPLPGAASGHMSFGGFSPALESLQAEVEAVRAAAAAKREPMPDSNTGAVISDEAMAAALARAQQRAAGGGGADAASGFQRPAAMSAVHFGVGTAAQAPTAGVSPGVRGADSDAAPASAGAAAARSIKQEDGQPHSQHDGGGILHFGADAEQDVQQPGSKKRKKKKKQGQQGQQQEGDVAPLRAPKRKKHERGQQLS